MGAAVGAALKRHQKPDHISTAGTEGMNPHSAFHFQKAAEEVAREKEERGDKGTITARAHRYMHHASVAAAGTGADENHAKFREHAEFIANRFKDWASKPDATEEHKVAAGESAANLGRKWSYAKQAGVNNAMMGRKMTSAVAEEHWEKEVAAFQARNTPKPAGPAQPVDSSSWTGRVSESVEDIGWYYSDVDERLVENFTDWYETAMVEEQVSRYPRMLAEATQLAVVYHQLAADSHKGGVWTPGDPNSLRLSKDYLPQQLAAAIAPKDDFSIDEFPRILKSWADKMGLPVADVLKLLLDFDFALTNPAKYVVEKFEKFYEATSNADKDLVPLPGTGIDNPEFDSGDPAEEESWIDGSTSSPIELDPTVNNCADEDGTGSRQVNAQKWRDPRLKDPRQNHRHPIRKRWLQMGNRLGKGIYDAERIENEEPPFLSDRGFYHRLAWDDDLTDADMDKMLDFYIQQQYNRDNYGVYAKILQTSNMSIEDQIAALKDYRARRKGWKGDGDNVAVEPSGDGVNNQLGGAYQS